MNNLKRKVSVIIPVFNTEDYLRECLNSVIGQTLREIQIICINDGSSDGSLDILNEYSELDDRIEIIDLKENVGLGPARNHGLKAAKATFVTFLDSDDYLKKETLNKLIANIGSCPGTDVLLFGCEAFSLETGAEDVVKRNNNYWNKGLKLYLKGENRSNFVTTLTEKRVSAMAQGKLYKLDFLKRNRIEFINGKYVHEDEGWLIKWISSSPNILSVEDKFYRWRTRPNSIMANIRESADHQSQSLKHLELVIGDALSHLKASGETNYRSYVRFLKRNRYMSIKYAVRYVMSLGSNKRYKAKSMWFKRKSLPFF